MLKCLLLTIAVACCLPAWATVDYAKANPPVELRAIWVDAGSIPKTEQGIREMVRRYHKANLNVLLPEVIARGYTVYPSKLLARDPRFAGAIDPLPPMISEAHALGMEVHPWVWVFRAGYTKDRGGILTAHPDWVELNKYGEDLSANGGLWISPCIPEARDFLAGLYRELITKYDVDGLHLDYIRYEVQSPAPYGYCQHMRDLFKKIYGVDPMDVDRLSDMQSYWNLFRERQVNTFVQRISTEMKSVKPTLVVSAAVGSDIKTARLSLLQNWGNWIDNKWVDFLTPMTYTDNDLSFAALVNNQNAQVASKAILAPGIGLHMQTKTPEQTVRQIGSTRQQLVPGQALFASAYFGDPQEAALIAGPYAQPADVPYREPGQKCSILAKSADGLRTSGDNEMADYLCGLATVVGNYAKFKETPSPYVPPTNPPLSIPPVVIPLPCVQITRASGPIVVDGGLDEPVWASAAKVLLGYTNTGEPAAPATTAMFTYDDTNLYVAYDAIEPKMDKLKATVDKRDGPTFYDDSVEVFVDPTAKRRDYYHLSTNALGTRFDQKVFSPAWNAEWSTATKRGPNGWTTEIAIPFASLRAPVPAAGTQWALNLTRNRVAGGSSQYFTWAVPYGSFHSPDRFGTVVFQ